MSQCKISSKCGGCTFIEFPYEEQLNKKTNYMKQLMKGVINAKIDNTIGMEMPLHYRNKGKYALKNGKMGFYEEGTHTIVYEKCIIQNEKINEVADYIFQLVKKYNISIYNEDNGKGFLRYVVIRYGINTDEIMIIFVTTNGRLFKRNEIIKDILNKFSNVKSIVQNINEKDTNAILGSKVYNLYGNDYIFDKIKINNVEFKFKISPLSFYQVNTIQMQVLYSKAIELAQLDNTQIVYDLYSGIGTISICISNNIKKVYGIEIVKDAVRDAVENAKINNIKNAKFISGKVEDLLPRLCATEKADVIFVDPPRSGLDKKTIDILLKVKPKKIVYISCNPETLKSDLINLKKQYVINEIQPVDMFPFTKHVECVTMLKLKNNL